MATTIQIKRSSTASAVPLAGDLEVGELAVNLADKRLFTKKSDGTVVELSTNPTDIDIATLRIDGVEVTASAAELNSLDGSTATTADLNKLAAVTATSTELNVLDGFTGSTAELNILDGVTATTAEINKLDGFTGTVDDLNYAKDLRATGVTTAEFDKLDGLTATTTELNYTDGVTSNIQTQLNAMVEKAGDTMTGDLSLGDNVKAKFGAGNDLQIYHSGSHSFVSDTGTGRLYLQGTDGVRVTNASAVNMISAVSGDGVYSYYNGSLKLATTSTGVDVTGTVTADGLDLPNGGFLNSARNSGSLSLPILGHPSGSDTVRYLSSDGHSFVNGSLTKALQIANNGDISFYEDTGTTAKFVWDSSDERLELGTSSGYTPVSTLAINETTNTPAIEIIPTVDDNNANTASIRLWGTRFGTVNRHSEIRNVTDGSTANNELAFDTNGTERMRIDSSGNVGIGTSSPSDTLEIADANSQLRLTDTDDSKFCQFSYSSGKLAIRNNATSVNHLWLDELGSLGIGTSSPSKPLHIQDTTNDGSGGILLQSYLPVIELDDISGGGTSTVIKHDGTNTIIENGGSERARIDSSGKLLVNTTTATDAQLTVKSDSGLHPAIKVSDGGANGYTLIADNYTANDSQVNLGVMHGSASAVLSWGVKPSDTTDSYVSSTGLYSKPPQALEMDSEGIKFLQGANAQVATDSAVTMSERMRLDSGGNLFVGTTAGDFTPKMAVHSGGRTYGLEVKANSGTNAPLLIRNDNGISGTRNQVFFLYGGTTTGSITSTSSSTSFNTTSDERLKENIQDTTHTVNINDIRVREFDWKLDGEHQRFGFIAQELETVYPEAVHSPDDPEEMKSVDYSKLVPLLVKEIQTLKARIETLENK